MFCFKSITRHKFVIKYLSGFIKLIYLLTFTFAIEIFLSFHFQEISFLICPKLKILKRINNEIDRHLVVVEYTLFLPNLSK